MPPRHVESEPGQSKLKVFKDRIRQEVVKALGTQECHVVISDMARGTVQDEGIRFLSQMRLKGFRQPVIFTVGRFDPGLGTPGHAFGITNRVDEMLNLLFDALERLNG